MLQSSLTDHAIVNRISKITNLGNVLGWDDRMKLALRLMELIDHHAVRIKGKFSPNTVSALRDEAWLALNGKLHQPSECWDLRLPESLLCDMVRTILPIELRSEHVRNLLGWKNVPFQALQSQLQAIMEADSDADGDGLSVTEKPKRVKEILKALASCYQDDKCTEDELVQLAHKLGKVDWVPVSGNRLQRAQRSTLEPTELSTRFSSVSSSLLAAKGVKALLKSMGITERPRVTELQVALHSIEDDLSQEIDAESRSGIITDSIRIAEEICRNSGEFDRSTLLVPTAKGKLANSPFVIFNDAGVDFPQLEEGLYFSHELMSAASAKVLGLQSFRALQLDQLGEDAYGFYLGEDITTRIRGVLADYDIKYSINEWIANAHDAGASCLRLLVDEASFEGPQILGDELHFQVSPALVVYNDATFQEEDFQGIGSVGKGGKGEKSNTIGRFGLGALTYYHFTELPMIVSGDTVVFLDPSRRYISLNKNGGGVRMSLQQCFVLYPELLKPLEDVFGFSTKSDYYDGTLLRFPLRTASQASKSEISKKEVTSRKLTALIEDFYEHSRYSLLFTSLHEISAHQRSSPETDPSQIWSITAYPTMEDQSNNNGDSFVTTLIDIDTEAPDGGASQQQWLVSRSSAFHSLINSWNIDPSLIERYRLAYRILDCGLAFELSADEFIDTSTLFATLPLPVPISLPVHVHATWILAQDRRSIRADASIQGTDPPPDAQFNRYIMQNSIPHLYLRSLAFINEHHSQLMNLFWPKRLGNDTDETVTNALYHQLPISEYQVLRTWEDKPISVKDAVIHLQTSPDSVRKILVALMLPTYVPHPHFDTSFFEGSSQVRCDSPSVLASILRNSVLQVDNLCKGDSPAITLEDVENILWYLIEGEIDLLGIPLLPLYNGIIVQFEEGPTVFASHQHQLSRLFGSNSIISAELSDDLTDTLTGQGTNVHLTDAAGMRELLNAKGMVAAPKRSRLSESEAQWHEELLSLLTGPDPPATLDELDDLPLIPTAGKDSTVSLRYARGGAVWRSLAWEDPHLKPILLELQIPVVDLRGLPDGLLQASEANLINVLTVLARFVPRLSEVNNRVSPTYWNNFALMVKAWITTENLTNILHSPEACQALCQLPLFNGQQGPTSMTFIPPSSLSMLPPSVSDPATIIKYLPRGTILAPYSNELHLVLQQFFPERILSVQNVIKQLHVNQNHLANSQEGEFRLVLTFITDYHRGKYRNPLIPDLNRNLRRPEDLYDHREELYLTSFQNRRHLFVHDDFRDSMDDWVRLGLRREVDETSLLACIKAVDEDTRNGGNTRLRAAWLWDYLNGGPSALWKLPYDHIRKLRFIPRDAQRHPPEAPSNATIRSLPIVVSPDDLSLPRYSSISWSQLGSFARPPNPVITSVYPEFGIPPVEHVVQHLVVLATNIAPSHAQSPWLLDSVKAVYDWLKNNKDKARRPLAALSASPIWLNVDDGSDTWTWRAANQLEFELGYDRTNVYDAKEFLHEYRELLLVVGASERRLPEVNPPKAETTPHSERVWSAFIKLLEDDQLVDICFAPEGAEHPISEHKLVLAAAIPHFILAFTSGFRESVASTSTDICMEYDLPPNTKPFSVRAVIDFAYKGVFSAPGSVTRDDADQTLENLLDLLRLCDLWEIPKLKNQGEEVIMRLI